MKQKKMQCKTNSNFKLFYSIVCPWTFNATYHCKDDTSEFIDNVEQEVITLHALFCLIVIWSFLPRRYNFFKNIEKNVDKVKTGLITKEEYSNFECKLRIKLQKIEVEETDHYKNLLRVAKKDILANKLIIKNSTGLIKINEDSDIIRWCKTDDYHNYSFSDLYPDKYIVVSFSDAHNWMKDRELYREDMLNKLGKKLLLFINEESTNVALNDKHEDLSNVLLKLLLQLVQSSSPKLNLDSFKQMYVTTQKDSDFINIQNAANEIRYGDFRFFSEYAHKGKIKLYIMPQNPDKQVGYHKVRSSYLEIIVNDSAYPDYIDKLKHNKGIIIEERMYLKDENGGIVIYEPPKEMTDQIPIKWVPEAIKLDVVFVRMKDLLQLKEEFEKERHTPEEDKLTMGRPAIKKNKEIFIVGTKDKVITPESEGVRLKKLRENNNANVSITMPPIPRKYYKLEDLLYGKIETKGYFKMYGEKARKILINKDKRTLEEAITWAYLMMRWHWDRGSGEFKRSQICTDLLQTEDWQNAEMLVHAYDFCKEQLNMLVEKSQYGLSETNSRRKSALKQAMKLSKVEYLAVFILVKIADALGRNETSDKDVNHAYSKILELEVKENSVKPMAVNMVEHSLQKSKLTQNNINVPKSSEKNLVNLNRNKHIFKKFYNSKLKKLGWNIVYNGKTSPLLFNVGLLYINVLIKHAGKTFTTACELFDTAMYQPSQNMLQSNDYESEANENSTIEKSKTTKTEQDFTKVNTRQLKMIKKNLENKNAEETAKEAFYQDKEKISSNLEKIALIDDELVKRNPLKKKYDSVRTGINNALENLKFVMPELYKHFEEDGNLCHRGGNFCYKKDGNNEWDKWDCYS